MTYRMSSVRWRDDQEICLEQPVPNNAQAFEHRSAKNNGIEKWCAVYILDHVGQTGSDKHFTDRFNKTWPLVGIAVAPGQIRIGLTGRRGVDGIKSGNKLRIKV